MATYTQGSGLAGNEITCLYFDPGGNLWIGSGKNKGLTRLHNGVFSIINTVGEVTPTCITGDKDGKLWIGTDSKGILVMDKDSVRHILSDDGLISNHINLLFCDEQNNVYAGTNLGLNKIDQHNNKILAYTKRVGFTGIETKANACYFDSRGYLWFGTVNGAIRGNIKLLAKEDTVRPVIRIDEMLVKGTPVALIQGKRFNSTENDITFRYSCVTLTNPEGTNFEVMLQGYDDTWQNQKNENTRVFTKLPPGRYVFKVKARNESGEWSTSPAVYNFRILAPFYLRGVCYCHCHLHHSCVDYCLHQNP